MQEHELAVCVGPVSQETVSVKEPREIWGSATRLFLSLQVVVDPFTSKVMISSGKSASRLSFGPQIMVVPGVLRVTPKGFILVPEPCASASAPRFLSPHVVVVVGEPKPSMPLSIGTICG